MEENKILNNEGAILTNKELEEYLEKVASNFNIKNKSDKKTYPIPRLIENYNVIKEVYNLLSEHLKLGIDIHPAGEWLLDNFYIIEESVKAIEKEVTLKKYINFVGIQNGRYEGLARIYVLAAEIINHTDSKINREALENYIIAYQKKKTLNMDEIWNIGLFMQIVIIENIRQISERIYIAQIEKAKVESIVERLVDNKKISAQKFNNIKSNRILKMYKDMKSPFIEYLSYKLKRYGKKTESYLNILEDITQKTGSTVSEIIKKEHFDIALRKVSIGNCITSIKNIQRINFLEVFEKINEVEEILKHDPADVYDKMDYKTKESYRTAIKEISKETKISEIYISKKVLEIAKKYKKEDKRSHIGYYLFGVNKNILYDYIGCKQKNILTEKKKTIIYIYSVYILTAIISILLSLEITQNLKSIILKIVTFIILFIPISEIIVQTFQYILGKIVKPKLIPKIDFYNGIDKENTSLVVIPTILKSKEKVDELMKKLEVFYLANKSENLYFCLLGDCAESDKEVESYDYEIVKEGIEKVKKLNQKYSTDIFNFIYRKRKWNSSEGSYLGWERKRGALLELVQYLNGKMQKSDVNKKYNINTLEELKSNNIKFKYIITLDADTDLVLNTAFELVGAMAHILNKPEIENGKVTKGYGLIQPRIGVNMDISYKNLFTKIFAGSGGIDSYTNAISDLYQDNFGEGIFTGKGIFDIETYSKVLGNEIPENTVLSHDLLEGSYLRCGLATDIMLMDGYPTKYNSFMMRLSRWIRGDWQIIRWIKSKKLNVLSKYKIIDNLRRSLIEALLIRGIIYFVCLRIFFEINILKPLIIFTIILIYPFLLEMLNLIIFKREGEAKQLKFSPNIDGFKGSIYRAFLTLGCMPFKVYISIKSIMISLFRMIISHKRLLEWTTSEEAEKNAKNDMFSYYKMMYANIILGLILLFLSNIYAKVIGIIWIITPSLMYLISKEKTKVKKVEKLNKDEKKYILDIAEKTFEFFKDNLNKENNYLIPDNYQEDRKDLYVDRTSSTNIGLSFLAVISGIDLGFIEKEEGINLIENILSTVEQLQKWNGHLYNWYNTKNKMPLIPRYISTVDSGNFVGYLYVLKTFLEKNNKYNLVERINSLIKDTDFSYLYSKEQSLFSIGYNIEENKLTDSYYDLLASEARQASFVAIAKKDIPSKHWNNLSRTLTVLDNRKGLVSWSGTSFEYLMPNINMPRYPGTLLDESSNFAIMSQMEYSRKLGIPWGISETAFNIKDLHSNYQYKAFGIPWLGLKRGLSDEIVISTYASVLAILDKPKEVIENLKWLEKYGMNNKYGFYESLDFTPARTSKYNKAEIVKTYMAHHQALVLISIDNLIKDNIFQKRFIENPEIEATSILLQERMPEKFIITKEEKEKPVKMTYKDYENYAENVYNKIDYRLIRGNVISNENYSVAINQKGEGYSKYKDILINRYKKHEDYAQGINFYFKNINTKKIWNIYENNSEIIFAPDSDCFKKVEGNIKTNMKITVDTEEAIEVRKIILENVGVDDETIEVTSIFEPILSRAEQDYAHPSFNNLFLIYNYYNEENILEVKRKVRGKDEVGLYLETMFETDAETVVDNEFEIEKEKINERGNLGVPTAIVKSIPFSKKICFTTEPIIAMKKTIRIKPKQKVNISLIISVNEDKEVALNNLRKYKVQENINKSFEISRAKIDAESRYLRIKGKEMLLYQKILSYILFDNPQKEKRMLRLKDEKYKQEDLWKYGISGDLPIILVEIKDVNDIYVVKQVLKMYEFLRTKNEKVEIVFLDSENYSYENFVREELENKISDYHLAYMKNIYGGIFVLSKNEINKEDINLLNFIADIKIDSHKGDLESAIEDEEDEYLNSYSEISDEYLNINKNKERENNQINVLENNENLKYYNEYGAFSPDGKEYLIKIDKENKLPTVWSNILSNEKFGTVVTENMGGYTWYKNSRLNRITSWHNNAFLDIPSEIIYIQDKGSGYNWSLGFSPIPDNNYYNIVYGLGYAKYIHSCLGINQEYTIFVPNEDSIKVGILKLSNNTVERKQIKIIYYINPVLGEDKLKTNANINLKYDSNLNIIIAENLYENTFNDKVYIFSSEKIKSYTGDRKFFLGKGDLKNPDAVKKYKLNNSNSLGKDSCIAIEIEVELDSMSDKEIVIGIGAEESLLDCRSISYKYSNVQNSVEELEKVKKKWHDIVGKIQVNTPLESMNIILNGWAVYQTISSRLLGRTGYYQSGGAYGFRDQLQDTLALKYINPEIMKNQIIKHSKHQFIEGDVEHWWHEEIGRGIRTKFSDDLLWMVFLTEEYIETTGDYSILDIETNYLEGKTLEENQDEKYDLYKESNIKEPIYMHLIRAIEKSLNFGENGIPKIGTGDWNDGFSDVGSKGKGESVWLGFFLYNVLERFMPILENKHDFEKIEKYKNIMSTLKENLNKFGWDGRWFRRAFTDNGEILGSLENEECRIDSIAQSWSIISGAGEKDKQLIAMESLENHLIDKENGILKLLDPPFENGKVNPGYIKSYLPGVRENGGQYTHASIWVIIAEAILGHGDKATELYRMINPIEHARTKEAASKYKVEPFSIVADIYGKSNLAGRGGWTWYTGSSSWFYKAGLEYILGMKIKNNELCFNPCISKEWKEYSIRYLYGQSVYNITVSNPKGRNSGVEEFKLNGNIIKEKKVTLIDDGSINKVEIIM